MSFGVLFPFSAATGSVGYFAASESIGVALAQNARALLVTNWGERVMRPDFGCNLIDFCFEQNRPQSVTPKIADRISSQFRKWMPLVSVTDVNVETRVENSSLDENELMVKLTLQYANTIVDLTQSIKP